MTFQYDPALVVRIGDFEDVRIDRTTKWGNPFIIGRDGNRAQCIAKYRIWIEQQPKLMAALEELRGKRIGCHCSPLPCHGDVHVRLLRRARMGREERWELYRLGYKHGLGPQGISRADMEWYLDYEDGYRAGVKALDGLRDTFFRRVL